MSNFKLENYVPVHVRLKKFWDTHPEGRIRTVIVEGGLMEGSVIFKAEVFRAVDDAEPSATGHAFEISSEGYVNKTSFLENAETSAVGRALANMGYETEKGIASREEMEKVQRMQGEQEDRPTTLAEAEEFARRAQEKTAAAENTGAFDASKHIAQSPDDQASDSQIKLLKTLASERDKDLDIYCLEKLDVMPEDLSKDGAKRLIDYLKEEPKTAKAAAAAGGPRRFEGKLEGKATTAQLALLAKICKQLEISVTTLIEQEYEGVTDPKELTKQQASDLITEYGTPRKAE